MEVRTVPKSKTPGIVKGTKSSEKRLLGLESTRRASEIRELNKVLKENNYGYSVPPSGELSQGFGYRGSGGHFPDLKIRDVTKGIGYLRKSYHSSGKKVKNSLEKIGQKEPFKRLKINSNAAIPDPIAKNLFGWAELGGYKDMEVLETDFKNSSENELREIKEVYGIEEEVPEEVVELSETSEAIISKGGFAGRVKLLEKFNNSQTKKPPKRDKENQRLIENHPKKQEEHEEGEVAGYRTPLKKINKFEFDSATKSLSIQKIKQKKAIYWTSKLISTVIKVSSPKNFLDEKKLLKKQKKKKADEDLDFMRAEPSIFEECNNNNQIETANPDPGRYFESESNNITIDPENPAEKPIEEGGNWRIKSFTPKQPANRPHRVLEEDKDPGSKPDPKGEMRIEGAENIRRKLFDPPSHSYIKSPGKTYKDIEEQFKEQKYLDEDFMPCFQSILGFNENHPHSPAKLQQYLWKRPEAIFKGDQNYTLFPKTGIDPCSVIQGEIGDCYFLCSVTALAEYEYRIKRLFLNSEKSDSGAYSLTLCVNGIWEEVVVDDFFPCKEHQGCDQSFQVAPDQDQRYYSPVFSYSKTNDIWVMVLEKAWAKIHGGYMNISVGTAGEALRDLTGAPTRTYFTDEIGVGNSLQDHWFNLEEAHDKAFVMTCATKELPRTKEQDIDPESGLTGLHGYALLGVYEVLEYEKEASGVDVRVIGRKIRLMKRRAEDDGNKNSAEAQSMAEWRAKASKITRVVKMRNPWGWSSWRLELSESDPIWRKFPQLRSLLGETGSRPGIVFMTYERFMEYFRSYSICYCYDTYTYSAQRFEKLVLSQNQQSHFTTVSIIKFEIETAGKYYFGLHQVNKRNFRKIDGYKYTNISLGIARKSSKSTSIRYAGMASKCDKDLWFKATCHPGVYYAYVDTPWVTSIVNQFVISAYGPGNMNFHLRPNPSSTFSTFLTHLLLQRAYKSKHLPLQKFEGFPQIGYKFQESQDGFSYFYFENKDPDVMFGCTVKFADLGKCRILPPFAQDEKTPHVNLKPNSSAIIGLRWPGEVGSYCLQYAIVPSFKPGGKDLITFAKKYGDPCLREKHGMDVGITCYIMSHEDGCIFYYENNSKDYILKEDIQLYLRDCHLEIGASVLGDDPNLIKFTLLPGANRLINVVRNEGTDPSVKVSCKAQFSFYVIYSEE